MVNGSQVRQATKAGDSGAGSPVRISSSDSMSAWMRTSGPSRIEQHYLRLTGLVAVLNGDVAL
jgi:hypothetical protein